MVTLREGRDPDEMIPEVEEPRFFKTKLILAVLWAMFSAVVVIPAAGLTFLSAYSTSAVARRLGVNTGWATYWYRVTAMLVVTPLRAFEYFFVPDDFHEKNPLVPATFPDEDGQ